MARRGARPGTRAHDLQRRWADRQVSRRRRSSSPDAVVVLLAALAVVTGPFWLYLATTLTGGR